MKESKKPPRYAWILIIQVSRYMNQGHVSNYFEVSLLAIQLQTLAEWSGAAYTPKWVIPP